ncbi:hypothetical protein E0Z10_g2279 [Xylaria hypoxylon]|uniref:C2H2-type domain-containing protein n=1 Tax=Xylaria hypoxylon TaxID=37992 RepID=A0A4Z0YRC7_9PEZI|nr:hypothetical protein E0Z10_g2279 [Xylaria hypoxylon]
MSNVISEDFLYNLACECEALFDELRDTPAKTNSELFTEFQQRFAIWAANLGVFARKSQCLDTRLRNSQYLQDLVARLLDILRRVLQRCKVETRSRGEGYPETIGLKESQTSFNDTHLADLKAIDYTLTRLNRLGVTIRQSNLGKADTRVERFATTLNLEPFEYLCANAVQTLYPNAHLSLRSYLSKSMTKRYADMLFLKSRQEKLMTRREPSIRLPSIPEVPISDSQGDIQIALPERIVNDSITANVSKMPPAASQSDLSSVNVQQIRSRLQTPTQASTNYCKTSSIQLGQKECSDAHPAYPTFDEWFGHMALHSRRWNERVYLTSSWVCPICESSQDVYNSPEALYSHMEGFHNADFTNEQLQLISRQSKIHQSRAWNACLLCCFVVEEHGNTGIPKRRKGELKQETTKSARKSLEMTNPHPQMSNTEFSDTSSDSDSADSHRHQQQQQIEDRSKVLARHVAAHLQALMILTLRFADIHNDGEGPGDNTNNDSINVDQGSSASERDDVESLSDIASKADIASDIAKEDTNDTEGAIDRDVVEDEILIPDTNVDLSDVPRQ